MKPQLYYYPGNANLAPHILLEEAGCEYELVLVDRAQRAQKSADYLRINPNGTIPTLVCGPPAGETRSPRGVSPHAEEGRMQRCPPRRG